MENKDLIEMIDKDLIMSSKPGYFWIIKEGLILGLMTKNNMPMIVNKTFIKNSIGDKTDNFLAYDFWTINNELVKADDIGFMDTDNELTKSDKIQAYIDSQQDAEFLSRVITTAQGDITDFFNYTTEIMEAIAIDGEIQVKNVDNYIKQIPQVSE